MSDLEARQPVELTLLGDIRLAGPDGVVDRFVEHRAKVLLARLAMARGRWLSRDAMTGMLWPDAPQDAADHRLSNTLCTLRNCFRQASVDMLPPIASRGGLVRLDVELVRVDALAFEDAVRAALRDPESSPAVWRAVVNRYSGPFLHGVRHDWVYESRDRLLALYLEALQGAARAAATAHPLDAIAYLERALDLDPDDLPSLQACVEVALEAGSRAGARQAALRLRASFERLGLPVDAPTAALLARALAEEPAANTSDTAPPSSPAAPAGQVTIDAQGAAETVVVIALGNPAAERCRRWSAAFADAAREMGAEPSPGDDGTVAATFQRATEAISAALAAVRAMAAPIASNVPDGAPGMLAGLVGEGRIAVHTSEGVGDAEARESLARALASTTDDGWFLCTTPSAALAAQWLDPAYRLEDVGVRRIGDPPTPIRLYAVVPATLAEPPAPRLTAPAVAAARSPQPPLPLFGRESERNAVLNAFIYESARLVTISGPGGVGKSSLARDVISEVLERLGGTSWVVEADGLDSQATLVDAIWRAVGAVPEQRDPHGGLLDRVRRHGTALLVLDGFERVVGAGGAPLVQQLLDAAPELRCLVTTRRRLDLPSESWHVLGPLPVPPVGAMADEIAAFAGAALFLDRARAAVPSFQLSPSTAADVVAICRRVDGLPLAIVLAAARLSVMDLEDLRRRLDASFEAVSSRSPGIPTRHHTLPNTIRWSLDLLPDDARRALAELSVFRGSFDVHAAEAVTGDPGVIDVIALLEESSLLTVSRTPDGPRFAMLEVIRECASQIVTPGAQCAERHALYFVDWADAHAAGHGLDADRARRLDAERENLFDAIAWLEQQRQLEQALRLATKLWRFWAARGPYRRGHDTLDGLLLSPEAAAVTDPGLLAAAQHGAGTLAYRLGAYDDAVAHYTAAREGYQRAGDLAGTAHAVNNLGMFAQLRGDHAAARREYAASLAIKTSLGDRPGMARGHLNLANVSFEAGDLEAGRGQAEACIAIPEAAADVLAAANAILGAIHEDQGHAEAARTAYILGLAQALEARAPHLEAQITRKLASWTHDHGELAEAVRLYHKAAEICRRTENLTLLADVNAGLSAVLLDVGQQAKALRLASSALLQLQEQGHASGVARLQITIGRILVARGDLDSARDALRLSAAWLTATADARRRIEVLEAYTILAALAGRGGEAAQIERSCLAGRAALSFPRPPNVQASLARQRGDVTPIDPPGDVAVTALDLDAALALAATI